MQERERTRYHNWELISPGDKLDLTRIINPIFHKVDETVAALSQWENIIVTELPPPSTQADVVVRFNRPLRILSLWINGIRGITETGQALFRLQADCRPMRTERFAGGLDTPTRRRPVGFDINPDGTVRPYLLDDVTWAAFAPEWRIHANALVHLSI